MSTVLRDAVIRAVVAVPVRLPEGTRLTPESLEQFAQETTLALEIAHAQRQYKETQRNSYRRSSFQAAEPVLPGRCYVCRYPIGMHSGNCPDRPLYS